MNPITQKLAEISPTYKPHGAQRHAIREAENPQEIADSIDAKMAAARRLAERHWGPGVAEVDDLMASMSLYGTGTFDPEIASARFLYTGLSKERVFELGQRSNDFIADLYREHIGREPDAAGEAFWRAEWTRQFVEGIKT